MSDVYAENHQKDVNPTERERFETYARSMGWDCERKAVPFTDSKNRDGDYAAYNVQMAWETWENLTSYRDKLSDLPTGSMTEWFVQAEEHGHRVSILITDAEEAKSWMGFLMERGDEKLF